MRPTWKDVAAELLDRLDRGLLPVLLRRGSLDVERVRAELRAAGLPYRHAEAGLDPSSEELLATAQALVDRAARRAAATAGVSGLGGALGVPPEVAAALLRTLRLAQRLACVYGFDPASAQGRALVRRALSAAWEVELPELALDEVRARDLPGALVRSQTGTTLDLAARVGRAAAGTALRRSLRLVPGLAGAVAIRAAARSVRDAGARMIEVLQAAHAASAAELASALEVQELPPDAPTSTGR